LESLVEEEEEEEEEDEEEEESLSLSWRHDVIRDPPPPLPFPSSCPSQGGSWIETRKFKAAQCWPKFSKVSIE